MQRSITSSSSSVQAGKDGSPPHTALSIARSADGATDSSGGIVFIINGTSYCTMLFSSEELNRDFIGGRLFDIFESDSHNFERFFIQRYIISDACIRGEEEEPDIEFQHILL